MISGRVTAPVSVRSALGQVGLFAGAGVAGLLVASPVGLRIAMAVGAACMLAVLALQAPRHVVMSLVVWFVALGLVRRLISGVSVKEVWGDPLLLVGTATWAVLAVIAVRRGALAKRSRLTTAVIFLAALLAASALNPLQGRFAVGVSGVLLVVLPMAAFLLGRTLVDDRMLRRLFVLVAWLGVGAAVYGLYQTFVAFPPWDERWVVEHGYTALNVGGVIRAFASFSAASEYTTFLGIAIAVWVAHVRGLARSSVAIAALGLLATALWYASARGIIVLTVVAVGSMLAARSGLSLGRSLLLGVAVLLALPVVIGRLAPTQFSDDDADRLAQHQVDGLTDPFGVGSTLPAHIDLVVNGVTGALRDPLGVGVGAVTIAGDKFGDTQRQTEADPGNVAVAAGFPGLVAYLAVVLIAVPRLYRQAAKWRDPLSLAALGIVLVTALQWLNGGHYATMFWPWLVLGWLDSKSESDGLTAEPRASDRLGTTGLRSHKTIAS